LDVIMLMAPPFSVATSSGVKPITTGALATVTSTTGAPVIIRNKQFLANPDANLSSYKDWQLVDNNVPNGANRVWVSNGHVSPVFYVTTTVGGVVQVFRRATGETAWTQLQGIGAAVLPGNADYGPLYVDPYDPSHIFVLTADGIRVPVIAPGTVLGATTPFVRDLELSAVVTNSGQYPLSVAFAGGNRRDVVWASQAGFFPKAVAGQLAFSPSARGATLVAAPLTGLFFQAGWLEHWQSLTPALPTPHTMVSTATMADDFYAYVGFEGRGVGRVANYRQAKLACYYSLAPVSGGTADDVAQLLKSPLEVIAGVPVSVSVVRNGVATTLSVTTSALGVVSVPAATSAVVRIEFAGNDDIAPCETTVRR